MAEHAALHAAELSKVRTRLSLVRLLLYLYSTCSHSLTSGSERRRRKKYNFSYLLSFFSKRPRLRFARCRAHYAEVTEEYKRACNEWGRMEESGELPTDYDEREAGGTWEMRETRKGQRGGFLSFLALALAGFPLHLSERFFFCSSLQLYKYLVCACALALPRGGHSTSSSLAHLVGVQYTWCVCRREKES